MSITRDTVARPTTGRLVRCNSQTLSHNRNQIHVILVTMTKSKEGKNPRTDAYPDHPHQSKIKNSISPSSSRSCSAINITPELHNDCASNDLSIYIKSSLLQNTINPSKIQDTDDSDDNTSTTSRTTSTHANPIWKPCIPPIFVDTIPNYPWCVLAKELYKHKDIQHVTAKMSRI